MHPFEQLPVEPVWLVGFAVVATLVALRWGLGSSWFGTGARHWQPLRRLAVPIFHRAAKRTVGEDWYAETTVTKHEHVATLALPLTEVLDLLAEAGYEPQPLASFATDWAGRQEAASWARYYGDRPFPGAPDWLRPRQVHVRLFVSDDAEGGPLTHVTAHAEATSWRPDQWRDHYTGATLDVDRGRELVAADLDLIDDS